MRESDLTHPFVHFWTYTLRVGKRRPEERNAMKALKNIEEAAGLLGISPWTVRSYIIQGKLRPVRIGRRVLIEEAELERFVAAAKLTK